MDPVDFFEWQQSCLLSICVMQQAFISDGLVIETVLQKPQGIRATITPNTRTIRLKIKLMFFMSLYYDERWKIVTDADHTPVFESLSLGFFRDMPALLAFVDEHPNLLFFIKTHGLSGNAVETERTMGLLPFGQGGSPQKSNAYTGDEDGQGQKDLFAKVVMQP